MHINAKPPIFVPREYRAEIEKMSKAALMDLVWDYASMNSGRCDDPNAVMHDLRSQRDVVLAHRSKP